MNTGLERTGRRGEMFHHCGKGQRRIVHGDQSRGLRSVTLASRHQHSASAGGEKKSPVFLISKEADICRRRGIERGHAGVRPIEPAPDDVTIGQTGELGESEGECHLGVFDQKRLLIANRSRRSEGRLLGFRSIRRRQAFLWSIFVEVLQQDRGDVRGVLGIEEEGNL